MGPAATRFAIAQPLAPEVDGLVSGDRRNGQANAVIAVGDELGRAARPDRGAGAIGDRQVRRDAPDHIEAQRCAGHRLHIEPRHNGTIEVAQERDPLALGCRVGREVYLLEVACLSRHRRP
jgi:hypothetical protein